VLSRAVVASAEDGVMTEEGVANLQHVIAASAARESIPQGLLLYDAALRAGFSPQEGARTVEQFLDSRSYDDIQVTAGPYRDVLQTFEGVGADPEAIKTLLAGIDQVSGSSQAEVCSTVRRAISNAAWHFDVTPHEMLDHLSGGLKRGLALPGMVEEVDDIFVPAYANQGAVDRYFTPVAGPLHHSPLPYRTESPLNIGIEDIVDLTDADTRRGEPVAEGSWFFDPTSQAWYSMGGETVNQGGGSILNYVTLYDASLVSDTPYHFHIHPNSLIPPAHRLSSALPSNNDYRAISAIAQASSGPVGMRSFVSHRLGFTEYVCPSDDPLGIESVAEGWNALQTTVFRSFDCADAEQLNDKYGEAIFPELIRRLNEALPDGFALRYYPHGTDIAGAIQDQAPSAQ